MPWLCWDCCSQYYTCCMNKGSTLNLDLIISGNFVVIMIMLRIIYVYMWVCMYVMSDRVITNHDYFMLMFICTYVCMYDID